MTLLSSRRPLRRGTGMALLIAVVLVLGCLMVLGSLASFLVDWLWFSAIGYLQVFWTIIAAKGVVFLVVFAATASILCVNGWVALGLAQQARLHRPTNFDWTSAGTVALPDVLDAMRHRLPWFAVVYGSAIILAMLVGWGEIHNWAVFLRYLHQVPFGASDPLFDRDIGFYLFSLPAYVAI